jgi:hypothetical protein
VLSFLYLSALNRHYFFFRYVFMCALVVNAVELLRMPELCCTCWEGFIRCVVGVVKQQQPPPQEAGGSPPSPHLNTPNESPPSPPPSTSFRTPNELRHARDEQDNNHGLVEAFPFEFGYHFGWVMSNVAISLIVSPAAPLVAAAACLFMVFKVRVDQYHLLHLRPRAFESGGTHMAHAVVVCLASIVLFAQLSLCYRLFLMVNSQGIQIGFWQSWTVFALFCATLWVLERRFWRLLFGWRLPPSFGGYALPCLDNFERTRLGQMLLPHVAELDGAGRGPGSGAPDPRAGLLESSTVIAASQVISSEFGCQDSYVPRLPWPDSPLNTARANSDSASPTGSPSYGSTTLSAAAHADPESMALKSQ